MLFTRKNREHTTNISNLFVFLFKAIGFQCGFHAEILVFPAAPKGGAGG